MVCDPSHDRSLSQVKVTARQTRLIMVRYLFSLTTNSLSHNLPVSMIRKLPPAMLIITLLLIRIICKIYFSRRSKQTCIGPTYRYLICTEPGIRLGPKSVLLISLNVPRNVERFWGNFPASHLMTDFLNGRKSGKPYDLSISASK